MKFKSKNCEIIYSIEENTVIIDSINVKLKNRGKGFAKIALKNFLEKFNLMKLPIPSMEKQNTIVDYLDFIYEKTIKTSNEKIEELKQLNEYCLNNQKIFGKNEIKTLCEICESQNGTNITKKDLIEGDFPVIGGGQKPMGYHNKYNCEENTILCSSSGSYAGYISKYNTKIWSSDCISINIINANIIINNYLF